MEIKPISTKNSKENINSGSAFQFALGIMSSNLKPCFLLGRSAA